MGGMVPMTPKGGLALQFSLFLMDRAGRFW
jgi:hypothetical protein